MDKQKEAEQKLAKFGYVHPIESTSNRDPQYSTYSDSGNDPYVTTKVETYAQFESKDNSSTVGSCPMCTLPALYMCSCPLKDSMCKNGHMWHTTKTGKVQIGDPHLD